MNLLTLFANIRRSSVTANIRDKALKDKPRDERREENQKDSFIEQHLQTLFNYTHGMKQSNLTSFLLCVLEKLSEMMYDIKVHSDTCDYRSIVMISEHFTHPLKSVTH